MVKKIEFSFFFKYAQYLEHCSNELCDWECDGKFKTPENVHILFSKIFISSPNPIKWPFIRIVLKIRFLMSGNSIWFGAKIKKFCQNLIYVCLPGAMLFQDQLNIHCLKVSWDWSRTMLFEILLPWCLELTGYFPWYTGITSPGLWSFGLFS